jgi:hypothetical protein
MLYIPVVIMAKVGSDSCKLYNVRFNIKNKIDMTFPYNMLGDAVDVASTVLN